MAQEMKAVVGLDINADDLTKELEDIFKQAASLIGNAMKGGGIKSPSDQNPEQKETKNMFKGMFASVKGIMGFAGKIFAGVSIGMAILKVFEPVMKIVMSFVKIIAEFLRPISDILIILLAPILSLMKPILIAFRGLMAPFKQAAMMGMAAAQKLVGEGTKQKLAGNSETGGAMISAGMAGTLSSASLMFSGMIGSIGKMLGLGDSVKKWQENALQGTIQTITLSNTFSDFKDTLGDVDLAWNNASTIVSNQMAIIEGSINSWDITEFDAALEASNSAVTAASGLMTGDISKIETAAEELNIPMTTLLGTLSASVEPAGILAQSYADIISGMNEVQRLQTMNAEKEQLTSNIESTKPGFFQQLGAGFKAMNDEMMAIEESGQSKFLSPLKEFRTGFSDSMETWKTESQASVDDFTTRWDQGFTKINTSMDTYIAGLSTATSDIESLAKRTKKAAKETENSYARAERAEKKYKLAR